MEIREGLSAYCPACLREYPALLEKYIRYLKDTQGTCLIDLSKVEIKKIIPQSSGFFSTAEICIISFRNMVFNT